MFPVSCSLDDILFNEAFDMEHAALERAKEWTKAGLPGVIITDGEQEFTVDEFTRRVTVSPTQKPAL